MSPFLSKIPFIASKEKFREKSLDDEDTHPVATPETPEDNDNSRIVILQPDSCRFSEDVCFGLSDTGKVRDCNEDYVLVDGERGIFMVSDGMGGANAGEVASREAVDVAYRYLKENYDSGKLTPENCEEYLHGALSISDDHVYEMAQKNVEMAGMGCTLVIACSFDGQVCIASIGDSRAYVLRSKGELEQLTEDHSLVWADYKAGRLTKEEARLHPQKNRLIQALGVGSKITPSMAMVSVSNGDKLLLCSDGLWDMLPEPDIAKIMVEDKSARLAAEHLVDAANLAGGHDNISVVIWYNRS